MFDMEIADSDFSCKLSLELRPCLWTGDVQSCTHQELLRGMLNGCPLTSCDLTSPDATTLVRQYQSAVFTPIMRVHMMQGTPRFPWFWPNDHDPEFQAH